MSPLNGQSGAGMVHMHITGSATHHLRTGFQTRAALAGAQAKRAPASAARVSAINFGGCVAPCTTSVPDGNHGDNERSIK